MYHDHFCSRRGRVIVSGIWFVFLAAVTGCANKTHESARSAESATATAPAPAEESSSSSPGGDTADDRAAPSPPQPPAASAPQSTVAPEGGAAKRSVGSAAGASERVTSPKAASAPTKRRASSDDLLREESSEPEQAFVEPAELAQVLLDFDHQVEVLSTTRACDTACLAIASMRRTAQRICDLVLDADPNQRCQTARLRLERASRDLAARCPSCK